MVSRGYKVLTTIYCGYCGQGYAHRKEIMGCQHQPQVASFPGLSHLQLQHAKTEGEGLGVLTM